MRSTWNSPWMRIAAIVGILAIFIMTFLGVVRPWHMRWGTNEQDMRRVLAGDELVAGATEVETRAIVIDAGIDRVWPWLAQLGQDRGGFYSVDALENAVGCEMPTEDVLRPDRQAWHLGDRLWMYPPEKAGSIGFATLRRYVPERALVFATHSPGLPPDVEDGTWAFILDPLGPDTTRFIVRGRSPTPPGLFGVAFDRLVFEPAHFVMERRMMIGIKQLAETGNRHRGLNDVHVALWTVTFVLIVVSAVETFRRRSGWLRALVSFVAAAAIFEALTLLQPPIAVGVALTAVPAAILWRPIRTVAGVPRRLRRAA
jgi:hypothetical protein